VTLGWEIVIGERTVALPLDDDDDDDDEEEDDEEEEEVGGDGAANDGFRLISATNAAPNLFNNFLLFNVPFAPDVICDDVEVDDCDGVDGNGVFDDDDGVGGDGSGREEAFAGATVFDGEVDDVGGLAVGVAVLAGGGGTAAVTVTWKDDGDVNIADERELLVVVLFFGDDWGPRIVPVDDAVELGDGVDDEVVTVDVEVVDDDDNTAGDELTAAAWAAWCSPAGAKLPAALLVSIIFNADAVDNAADRRRPLTNAVPNLFNFFGFFRRLPPLDVATVVVVLTFALLGVSGERGVPPDGGERSGPRPSDGNSNTVVTDGGTPVRPPARRSVRIFCVTIEANAPPWPLPVDDGDLVSPPVPSLLPPTEGWVSSSTMTSPPTSWFFLARNTSIKFCPGRATCIAEFRLFSRACLRNFDATAIADTGVTVPAAEISCDDWGTWPRPPPGVTGSLSFDADVVDVGDDADDVVTPTKVLDVWEWWGWWWEDGDDVWLGDDDGNKLLLVNMVDGARTGGGGNGRAGDDVALDDVVVLLLLLGEDPSAVGTVTTGGGECAWCCVDGDVDDTKGV
jgi:hypothetical protein